MRSRVTRVVATISMSLTVVVALVGASYRLSSAPSAHAQAPAPAKPAVVYSNLALPNGDSAVVFSNGIAEVFGRDRTQVEFRQVPLSPSFGDGAMAGELPDKANLIADLAAARTCSAGC